MTTPQLVERYAFQLSGNVYLDCYGYRLDLDRLVRGAISEFTREVFPEGMFDRLEPANKREFYATIFDKWLLWKQSLDDTLIQVDERYDEATDAVILCGFR